MNNNENEVLNPEEQNNFAKTESETELSNATENSAEISETIAENDTLVAQLEAKLAESNDKYLRLYSEFDNFRKRNAKERIDLIKTAGEDIFKAVLPVIDDFERDIKDNEKATELAPVNEGIQLIYSKMKNLFKNKGLEEMDCKGQVFDAELMEAITSIPAPTEDLKGKVVDEVEKGYKLGEKVIRFAKVVIGS